MYVVNTCRLPFFVCFFSLSLSVSRAAAIRLYEYDHRGRVFQCTFWILVFAFRQRQFRTCVRGGSCMDAEKCSDGKGNFQNSYVAGGGEEKNQ